MVTMPGDPVHRDLVPIRKRADMVFLSVASTHFFHRRPIGSLFIARKLIRRGIKREAKTLRNASRRIRCVAILAKFNSIGGAERLG